MSQMEIAEFVEKHPDQLFCPRDLEEQFQTTIRASMLKSLCKFKFIECYHTDQRKAHDRGFFFYGMWLE